MAGSMLLLYGIKEVHGPLFTFFLYFFYKMIMPFRNSQIESLLHLLGFFDSMIPNNRVSKRHSNMAKTSSHIQIIFC